MTKIKTSVLVWWVTDFTDNGINIHVSTPQCSVRINFMSSDTCKNGIAIWSRTHDWREYQCDIYNVPHRFCDSWSNNSDPIMCHQALLLSVFDARSNGWSTTEQRLPYVNRGTDSCGMRDNCLLDICRLVTNVIMTISSSLWSRISL